MKKQKAISVSKIKTALKFQANNPEPAVNCTFTKLQALDLFVPNPRNPNQHGEDQLRLYAKILIHQGWRKAIVVSNQSGFIVTGHGAWLAAVREGWKQAPADLQDFKSSDDELQHMLADNQLQQMASFDDEVVAAILAGELAGSDLELSGALSEAPGVPELKPLDVQAPPKMAWVLIGIPLVKFSEINSEIEQIAKLPETIVETTVADGEFAPKR